jgi:monoamine oxidase
MIRRELARALLVLAAAPTLACRVTEPAQLPGPTRRVIVVGAGVAGLVVAQLLQAAAIDVVVLEARASVRALRASRGCDGARRRGTDQSSSSPNSTPTRSGIDSNGSGRTSSPRSATNSSTYPSALQRYTVSVPSSGSRIQ